MTNAKEATRIKIASEQEALQLRLRVVELENAVNSRTNEVEVLRRENSRLESSFQKQQKDVRSKKQKKHLSVFFIDISYLNNTTNYNYFPHN